MSKNLYLFDCFGVVISDVSTLFLNKYITDAAEKEYMRKQVFRKVDVGEMPHERMYEIVSERYNIPLSTVISEWHSCEKVKTETVEVIKRLRKGGHTVALLSNAAVEYVDYLFDKFDLFKYFDKIFVSARYGCAKPDREFYEICVKSFDEKFDRIFFTDDNAVNLADLEQFGITSVLYTCTQDFESAVCSQK